MKKEKYECPRFEFQELHLMERVAATCWGHKIPLDGGALGYFDKDGDGFNTTQGDIAVYIKPEEAGNGCKGLGEAILNYLIGKQIDMTNILVEENTSSKKFIMATS